MVREGVGWRLNKASQILKERVGGFFTGNGRGGTVTGVDDCFSRKGKDLFSDSGEQQVAVAAGKVPAAHPIGKENVPAKKLILGGKVKTQASRAVPRDEKKLGVFPVGWKRGGFFQKLGGMDRAKPLGEAKGEHRVRLDAKKRGVGMIVDGATSPVGEVGGIPDMVPVTVGKQEGVWFQLFLFEKIEEAFRGIDGQAVAAQIDEVGVGGGEATAVAQGFRHGSSFLRLFVYVYDDVWVSQKTGSERVGDKGGRR